MSKFRVGDKVVITAKERPLYFNRAGNMDKYLNKKRVATITDIGAFLDYEIDNEWEVYGRNLELAKQNLKSFYNDKTVVYFNKDGKKGVAVNTDKKFDLEKGLAFAMLKTYGVTYSDFKEVLDGLVKQDSKKKSIKNVEPKKEIKKVKGTKNGKSNTSKNK